MHNLLFKWQSYKSICVTEAQIKTKVLKAVISLNSAISLFVKNVEGTKFDILVNNYVFFYDYTQKF